MLNETAQKRIVELKDRFPKKRSAILPALHVVLEEIGFYDRDTLKQVAELLDLSEMEVAETLSFYTYFPKEGVGKYHIQVCTNVSCMLSGAEQLKECLEEKLGIRPGQTTSDGLFTLTEVECLGSCGTAPVMQINQKYYENLTRARVDEILTGLREGKEI
jgi:NADH-quinone oxidoreductase E subunit